MNTGLQPRAIAVQPDNKIIFGGDRTQWDGTHTFRRVNPDGSLDPTFFATGNGSNKYQTNVNDMAVQQDGKIIVVGAFDTINNTPHKSIVRLNSDGSVDESFDFNYPFNSANIRVVALQPDGKILIAGSFDLFSYVLRLDSSGHTDPSWGSTGADNSIERLVLTEDGKAIICGPFRSVNGYPHSFVARLKANGRPDESFVTPAFDGFPEPFVAAAVAQKNGKILIGGHFDHVNGIPRTGIARLNTDGSVDETFDVALITSGQFEIVFAIVEQRGGQFVIGGSFSKVNGLARYSLSRLTTLPRRTEFDYDGDGKTDISIFRPTDGSWYVERSNEALYGTQFGFGSDKIAPADYDGDGKTDIAVYRPETGIWYVFQSSTGTVDYTVFGLAEDLPTPADYDGDGKADISVFRPSTATWYRRNSSDGSFFARQFGLAKTNQRSVILTATARRTSPSSGLAG